MAVLNQMPRDWVRKQVLNATDEERRRHRIFIGGSGLMRNLEKALNARLDGDEVLYAEHRQAAKESMIRLLADWDEEEKVR